MIRRPRLIAERLLRRALSFDPDSDATGYLGIVLIRQGRLGAEADRGSHAMRRAVTCGSSSSARPAEHAPDELPNALDLLDDVTLARDGSRGGRGAGRRDRGRHAPAHMAAILDRLPATARSCRTSTTRALRASARRPGDPAPRARAARTVPRIRPRRAPALVMGVEQRLYPRARAQATTSSRSSSPTVASRTEPRIPTSITPPRAPTPPSARIDRAIEQVALAIEHGYEHSEKMETDTDLSALQGDPRFAQLFNEWRTRRADLN